MIDRHNPLRNAGITVVQTLISGATLFLLYRYLLTTIGPDSIGIWSIVLATTSASRLSDLGISASVVRFVAKYLAHSDTDGAATIIQTAALSIAAVLSVGLLVGYPIFVWILRRIVPAGSQNAAVDLVPYALFSFWISAQATVYQSALDGSKRFDLRNITSAGGNVLYLLLALILIPSHGLLGLAYVQLTQSVILLVVSWTLLRYQLPTLPLVPSTWSKYAFTEMVSYGINFQIVSVSVILVDFTTKALLSRFGGLSDVAFFDMATRMVLQLRGLLTSANQVIVPYVTTINETQPARLPVVYTRSYELVSYIGLGAFGAVLCLLPIISLLWIGRTESTFLFFAVLLTVAWGLNSLSGPAYFANLGTGRLYWNTWSHVVMGLLNLGLGLVLGLSFGSRGVVVGLAVALLFGSSLVVISYHRENNISKRVLLPKRNGRLAMAVVIAVLLTWTLFGALHAGMRIQMLALVSFVPALLLFVVMWQHPLRPEMIATLRRSAVQTPSA